MTHKFLPVLTTLVVLAGWMLVAASFVDAQEADTNKKTSLEQIGVEGRDTLRNIGQSYGLEICGNGFIKGKDEIKKKAWPRLQAKCSKFTLKIMENYEDDPNKLFSLCIGGSLYGCQKAIDVAYPCDDLKSCRESLGVP